MRKTSRSARVGAVGVRRLALAAAGGAAALAAGLGASLGADAQEQGFFAQAAKVALDPSAAVRVRPFYDENCASCHGGDLSGAQFGPPLKGASFATKWRPQSADALVNYIQTRMPPGAAGTLSADTAASLAAYIVQVNAAAGPPASPEPAQAAAPRPPEEPRFDDSFNRPNVQNRDPGLAQATAQRKAPLDRLRPVTDAMLASPPDGDWLMWRRTYDSHGFSRLAQINKATVKGLKSAWSWAVPVSQNEITPLVHDGVLFLTSGNAVQALNAANGDLLWQYVRSLPAEYVQGRASRVKSIAIYKDRLYVPTADGHLVALDVKTGKVVFDHEVATDAQIAMNGQAEGVALHMDGGPIIAKGKVIIGTSLGITNARGGCFIVALDAETGRELWRVNTVDQRPPGQDSWNGWPVDSRFGAGVWTAGSYDPETNLIFFGTGNTYDTALLLEPNAGGKVGPNDALYTDSTLAIDVDTGKLAWHYQHVRRDVWDLDWVFEQTLMTVRVDGKPRKVVVTAGKLGMFEALDRKTGQYVFSKDMGLQNLITAVDPKTGEKTISPAAQPEAGKAKFICPNTFGARNWPATAFNPGTGMIYVPLLEACMEYTYTPRSREETAKGGLDAQFGLRFRPEADGKFGRIAAVDLKTRQIAWTQRQRAPLASSALATAGGVLFTGDRDRWFRALDQATGKTLWETRLNAAPYSTPITYMVGGEQYVAVVSGGGSALDGGSGAFATEINSPAGGTAVNVFKLPKAAGAAKR